jgi:hypothetical protein
MGAYEVASVLQGWQRSRATQADHHRAMYIAAKPHVSDQTASEIGAYVSGRRAYYKKIDIRHLALGPLQARSYRSAAGFHGAEQVALVQFAGCFLADLAGRNIKVPVVDIAIAKDLKDSRACIASHLEGLVLAEAARRVRQADRFDLNGSQEMLPSLICTRHGYPPRSYFKDFDDSGFIPDLDLQRVGSRDASETVARSNAAPLLRCHRRTAP